MLWKITERLLRIKQRLILLGPAEFEENLQSSIKIRWRDVKKTEDVKFSKVEKE